LETQVDDLSGQVVGFVMEELLKHGALDVFTQPIGMKKSRPGILITVICECDRLTICEEILFRETTTLGIRRRLQERVVLSRDIHEIDTPLGTARVKVGHDLLTAQPEYEDCARLSRQHQIPIRQVQYLVHQAWLNQVVIKKSQ
jgi:pyridinium-3,5-bisthiocarboxylic acid mononucleotide nickel chelatase